MMKKLKDVKPVTWLTWFLVLSCVLNAFQLCYWGVVNQTVFTHGTYLEEPDAQKGYVSDGDHGKVISIQEDGVLYYFNNGAQETTATGRCEINDKTAVFFDGDGNYIGYAYLYGHDRIKAVMADGDTIICNKQGAYAVIP